MTKIDNKNKKWNLSERTIAFGKEIILFCKKIPKSPINIPLITQLVKSGTSVGANYCEADNAESKKDFKHKIGIVKKEASESTYFIKMIITAVPELNVDGNRLLKEAQELTLIFNSIYNKVK